MIHPDPLYQLAAEHRRGLEQEAATERLARTARTPGARLDARLLLPLADACIALGLRLRQRYQPHESFALVPVARLTQRMSPYTGATRTHSGAVVPIFAFQVIRCQPQQATALTYWSLMPSEQGAAAGAAGMGLVCLARSLD